MDSNGGASTIDMPFAYFLKRSLDGTNWCPQNGIGIPLCGILESSHRHLYLPTAETTSWRQEMQMPVPAGTAVMRKYTFHEEVKIWACLSDANRLESSPSPHLIDSGSVFYASGGSSSTSSEWTTPGTSHPCRTSQTRH